jgi:hypothetical protein
VSEPGRGAPAGAWYFAWLAIGGGYALAVLSIMTIGILILPIVIGATVFVATRPGSRPGVMGLVSGLGLPLLYVAFLNRDGPGTVCTTTSSSVSCTDEWSPWPWLAAGIACIALGAAIFRSRQRTPD